MQKSQIGKTPSSSSISNKRSIRQSHTEKTRSHSKKDFDSFLATQQSPPMEANFLYFEDQLSRNMNYINQNLSRLPYFQTSKEAEDELRSLYEKLRAFNESSNNNISRNKDEENKIVDKRFSRITQKHQVISEEEQKIRKLRALNEDEQLKEENEYKAVIGKIKEARSLLIKMQKKLEKYNEKAEEARKSLENTQMKLETNNSKIQQLQTEEKRLLKLQKQTRQELKAISNEANQASIEEAAIKEVEKTIADHSKTLSKLNKTLQSKTKKAQEKREKIQDLLSKMESLEFQLDETIESASNSSLSARKTMTASNVKEDEEESEDDALLNQDIGSLLKPKPILPTNFRRKEMVLPKIEEFNSNSMEESTVTENQYTENNDNEENLSNLNESLNSTSKENSDSNLNVNTSNQDTDNDEVIDDVEDDDLLRSHVSDSNISSDAALRNDSIGQQVNLLRTPKLNLNDGDSSNSEKPSPNATPTNQTINKGEAKGAVEIALKALQEPLEDAESVMGKVNMFVIKNTK